MGSSEIRPCIAHNPRVHDKQLSTKCTLFDHAKSPALASQCSICAELIGTSHFRRFAANFSELWDWHSLDISPLLGWLNWEETAYHEYWENEMVTLDIIQVFLALCLTTKLVQWGIHIRTFKRFVLPDDIKTWIILIHGLFNTTLQENIFPVVSWSLTHGSSCPGFIKRGLMTNKSHAR